MTPAEHAAVVREALDALANGHWGDATLLKRAEESCAALEAQAAGKASEPEDEPSVALHAGFVREAPPEMAASGSLASPGATGTTAEPTTIRELREHHTAGGGHSWDEDELIAAWDALVASRDAALAQVAEERQGRDDAISAHRACEVTVTALEAQVAELTRERDDDPYWIASRAMWRDKALAAEAQLEAARQALRDFEKLPMARGAGIALDSDALQAWRERAGRLAGDGGEAAQPPHRTSGMAHMHTDGQRERLGLPRFDAAIEVPPRPTEAEFSSLPVLDLPAVVPPVDTPAGGCPECGAIAAPRAHHREDCSLAAVVPPVVDEP